MTIHLEMTNIDKAFPGVRALNGVDFAVAGGEVHALLGANGAGKSTLMKVLSGAYEPDGGEIRIGGETCRIRSPRDALHAGIHCVYQEVDTALVPDLSVAENIMLDRVAAGGGAGWVHWRLLRREAAEALRRLGADSIPPHRLVQELTLSEKQLVLIARALVQEAKFLILDEPTAPLSLEEANRLFAVIRQLRRDGVGCIYISHRLPEVFELCDRVTVMRDGRRISTRPVADATMEGLIEEMLGKPFQEEFPKAECPIGEVVLEAENLAWGTKVRDVGLTVRRGEIVGVVGFVGAGKTELSRLLFGAETPERGRIAVNGRTRSFRTPQDAIRSGIGLIPEERRRQGVLVGESVSRNLSLASLRKFSAWGFIARRLERDNAEVWTERLGIKTPGVDQRVGFLSGGNQQKVAIGKWLSTHADVLLFDEPTKGVDIGAKSDIFRIIGELAGQGKGILYLSSEFAEVLGIADRICVMSGGRIVKELSREEATQETLLWYASGGKEQTKA